MADTGDVRTDDTAAEAARQPFAAGTAPGADVVHCGRDLPDADLDGLCDAMMGSMGCIVPKGVG